MADDEGRDAKDGVDTEYSPEEQAEWDGQSERERVAEVTGVGPYDTDEDEDSKT